MQLPFEVQRMGEALRAAVERQLIADFLHHCSTPDGDKLRLDWSDVCQEGHVTECFGGRLEDLSNVGICDEAGILIGAGWIDFIHGGGDHPLFVFWSQLSVRDGEGWREVKKGFAIPEHVWDRLPESSKDACAVETQYDSRWSTDPLVIAWRRARGR